MDSYTLFQLCYESCTIYYPSIVVDLIKENAFNIALYSSVGSAIYLCRKELIKCNSGSAGKSLDERIVD